MSVSTSPFDLDEVLSVLKDASYQAGAVIRSALMTPPGLIQNGTTTSTTSNNGNYNNHRMNVVTECDHQCQELIVKLLQDKYPGVRIMGEGTSAASAVITADNNNDEKEEEEEETMVYDLTDEPTFTMNAIDGTANFVHGLPLISVVIAFVHKGKPLVGVTYAPILDEMFFAVQGKGAFLQNNPMPPQRIAVSNTTQIKQALLSMTPGKGRDDSSIQRFQSTQKAILQKKIRHIRDLGCTSLTLAYVACGRLDAALEEGSWQDDTGPKLWDLAAGTLLVQQAGGVTRDITHRAFRTKDLDLRQRSCFVASTTDLADELIDTIYATPAATKVNHLLQNVLSKHSNNNNGSHATVLRDKLQQMEDEKGETEQVLSNLRGKLEQHRQRSIIKRQRLKQQRQEEGATTGPFSTAAAPGQHTSADNPQHPNSTSDMMLNNENMINISSDVSVAASVGTMKSSFDEAEALELEQKIHQLEEQKAEMEQTMLQLLTDYESKSLSLQQEQIRMKDAKDTTYEEMKGLLIEQHQESERLRSKVTRVERKRKRLLRVAKRSAAATVIAVFVATIYALMGGILDDWNLLLTSRNHLCAPARPGSQITFDTGPVEAPWWAVTFTKPFWFALFCSDRPRIRLEIDKNGGLFVVDRDDPLSLTKKFGDTVYIEADTMHITDRRGGHKEMSAPWARSEVLALKKETAS